MAVVAVLKEGLKSSPSQVCLNLASRRTQSCRLNSRLHSPQKHFALASCASVSLLWCKKQDRPDKRVRPSPYKRSVARATAALAQTGLGRVEVSTLERDAANLVWAHDVDLELPLAPEYLAKDLAACLLNIHNAENELEAILLARKILTQLSYEIGDILTLPASERAGRLDGLLDLSTPPENANHRRELRRRLHQALENMVRWFLHDPGIHLADIGDDSASIRSFASWAIGKKRELRRLCQSSVAFSTSPPSESEDEEASVDAAAVHGLKRWSKAFKEWCFQTIQYYFLLDRDLRTRWLTGRRDERFRVTVLTHCLRNLVSQRGQENLPHLPADTWGSLVRSVAERVLVERPRVLDVGSCTNYFGRFHGADLDVTALDLAPGHSSVLGCNFLEMTIGPGGSGSDVKARDGPEGLVAEELPAKHFDVVIMALLFSVLPSPEARGIAAAKARQVLKDSGRGLLIIADTKGTVGLHCDHATRTSQWVAAVEANGFKLASDPQLHLSREYVKGRKGYWQRSFCWTFWTDHFYSDQAPVPVPTLNDLRKPRSLSPERLQAQQQREAKRQARAQKAQILKMAKLAKKTALRVFWPWVSGLMNVDYELWKIHGNYGKHILIAARCCLFNQHPQLCLLQCIDFANIRFYGSNARQHCDNTVNTVFSIQQFVYTLCLYFY